MEDSQRNSFAEVRQTIGDANMLELDEIVADYFDEHFDLPPTLQECLKERMFE